MSHEIDSLAAKGTMQSHEIAPLAAKGTMQSHEIAPLAAKDAMQSHEVAPLAAKDRAVSHSLAAMAEAELLARRPNAVLGCVKGAGADQSLAVALLGDLKASDLALERVGEGLGHVDFGEGALHASGLLQVFIDADGELSFILGLAIALVELTLKEHGEVFVFGDEANGGGDGVELSMDAALSPHDPHPFIELTV